MFRIGLISDVHGDHRGLQNALELFEMHNVDRVLCAGDLVDKGYQPNEVVQLMQQHDIACVMGNHDEEPFETHYLTNETYAYLAELPETLDLELGGRSICVAHGAPWNNWEYVFPDSDNSVFEELVEECGADIIVLGHTHTPMTVKINNGQHWIVNPGTVNSEWCYDAPTCGVLTLSNSVTFQVYDLDRWELARHDQLSVTL